MSIQSQPPKARRVNLAKFDDWLKKNTSSCKCPFCQGEDWILPNSDTLVGCAIPWGNGTGDMYMTGMPVLPLVCKKCLFVRPISLTRELQAEVLEERE